MLIVIIAYNSMKYFVARQNYEENALLDFYGNIDHFLMCFIYSNNNKEVRYCCFSIAEMLSARTTI